MITQAQIGSVRELISQYRSITVEKITGIRENESVYWQKKDPVAPCDILTWITGFGNRSCILCVAFKDCHECICWTGNFQSYPCTQHDTYQAILNSKSDEDLITAIRARADYLEELLNHE